MKWLLWKDYRHNRAVVIAGLFILLTPHLIALYATCMQIFIWSDTFRWTFNLAHSSIYSLIISQVTVALIGGNAIAGERVDRSAEFLFSLPIARKKMLASKILLSLTIVAVIWLLNAPGLWCYAKVLHLGEWAVEQHLSLLGHTAITGAVFFCVAWLLSSLITSSALAVCGGLVTPVIVGTGIVFINYLFELDMTDVDVKLWYRIICLTLAPVCFAIGTWHYLQRVEP